MNLFVGLTAALTLCAASLTAHPTYGRAARYATRDLVIYDDALAAGWQNWSWNTTPNFAAAAPVHSGSASLAVTYTQAWAGLSLRAPSPIDAASLSALTFWGYGAGTSGSGTKLTIFTQSTDAAGNSTQVTRDLPAGTWTAVTVTLAELGNPAAIARINIQDASGAAQPTFYLDELRLTASATPSPSPTPPTTLAGQITLDTRGPGIALNREHLLGSNMAMWIDKTTVYPNTTFLARTRAAGRGIMRLPGGAASQEYGWLSCEMQAHQPGALPCAFGGNPDAFWQARATDMLNFVRATGREAIYSVNINGSAKEAAAAVAFFNAAITDTTSLGVDIRGTDWYTAGHWATLRSAHGNPEPLGIHVWEFGNETYGGKPGHTGCVDYGWETTWTCNGVEYINGIGSGATRHEGYTEFRNAMRAVDSSIVLGAVGTVDTTSYNNWGQDVLQAGKDSIDFYFIHPYSYNEVPANNAAGYAQILALPQTQLAAISSTLQSALQTYAGGRQIPIWITEHNLTAAWTYDNEQLMTRAVNGLFMADTLGQAAAQRYTGVAQWMLLDGNQANGTSYGLLNADKSYARAPQYWAQVLWSRFGDELLPTTAALNPATQLSVYGGREVGSGVYSLLAINKTGAPISTTVALAGAGPMGSVTADVAQAASLGAQTMSFNNIADPADDLANAPATTLAASGNTLAYTFAPYSITLLRMTTAAAVDLPQHIYLPLAPR